MAAAAFSDDDALIREHGGLLHYFARLISLRTSVPAEELWSAGAMGLLSAARKYDPTRGPTFTTFARQRVMGAMLDEARGLNILPRRLALAQREAGVRFFFDVDPVASLCDDVTATPFEALERTEKRERLRCAITRLPERERHVFTRYLFDGCTQAQISGELDISSPRVNQILHAAAVKLRKWLGVVGPLL